MIRLLLVLALPIAVFCIGFGAEWFRRMWGLAALNRKLAHNDSLFAIQVDLQKSIDEGLDRQIGALRDLLAEDEEGVAFLTTSQRAAIERVVAIKREES